MDIDISMPDYLQEDVDTIHARMLGNAPSDVSTVEGDFFWSQTRTVAEEIARFKEVQLKSFIKLVFPQTSYGKYLALIGEPEGVTKKLAEKTTGSLKVKGKPGTVLGVGKIAGTISTDIIKSIEFEFIESQTIDETGISYVKVQCTQDGVIGNVQAESISILVTPINGVESVTNEVKFTNGVDVESDEDYLDRILEKKRTPSTSGNKYHYKNWAKEVTGVGDAKVFPLWNGNGTVKVVIIDSNKHGASEELITKVAEHIEENRPIGATVTIVSAQEKQISISVTLIIDTQKYTLSQIQTAIEANLAQYYKNIAFVNNYVSYASIGNLIFNTDGIIDYSNLLVNGGISNIALQAEEIPVLGTVSLGV